MLRRSVQFVGIAVVLGASWCCGSVEALAEGPAAGRGTIEGTVTYRADAAHPWRYARYYVRHAKSGELAEAVVALRGKGLAEARRGAAVTEKIDQHDFQFDPELVAIRVGDSVTFTNTDKTTHNVRASGELASFNITMAAGGAGQTVKFERAGGAQRPVEIGCVFHSNMRAWVFVFDHPFYQVTKEDGRYRLADVPAGEYELEVVHPAGGMRSRKPITVRAGETVKVDVQLSGANVR